MNRIYLIVVLLVVWAAAPAGILAPPPAEVEGRMLVTGQIRVATDGSVEGFTLDRTGKLPKEVVSLVNQAVPDWKFEPVLVAGQRAHVTTDMRVLVVAKKLDEDRYRLRIRSATFGNAPTAPGEAVTSVNLAPPDYPSHAAHAGAQGTVYMLVKVGRDGSVVDSIVEMVNLKSVRSSASVEQWRGALGDNASRQSRKWKFAPPTHGESADDEFWVVRVPVVYTLDGSGSTAYGKWEVYVPGPRQTNPWEEDDEGAAFSPDALAPGAAYIAGSGLKLLTSLPES